jgi:hypothetical protein
MPKAGEKPASGKGVSGSEARNLTFIKHAPPRERCFRKGLRKLAGDVAPAARRQWRVRLLAWR